MNRRRCPRPTRKNFDERALADERRRLKTGEQGDPQAAGSRIACAAVVVHHQSWPRFDVDVLACLRQMPNGRRRRDEHDQLV